MEIFEVKDKQALKKFIDLPWKIYRDYPHWVPPLKKEVAETLSREKNPFFKHSEASYFLVKEEKEVLGRIAAIHNRNHNSFHNEKTGFFGFFETVKDYQVAELLFNKVKDWCKERGLNTLRGPINFSTNDECGLLIEGFDKDPAIMMPYNPPYYAEYIERSGFIKAKDLYAFFKSHEEPRERVRKLLNRVKKKNITIRNIDMKHFQKEMNTIKEIYNSAWKDNWSFIPITDEEADLMLKKFKPLINPELVYFAEINNKPAGFSLAIPDYNQALKYLNGKFGLIKIIKFLWHKRKTNLLRLLALGIKKEYRNLGIELFLCCEILETGRKVGLFGELSWTLEDNNLINKVIEEMGAVLYKKYRIYEMAIR